ncbi:cytochrome c(L), periplasmic [Chenggangzhangella methanolivorans]|uniref:Cytochrome c-L n=1 Tax=Chenggangzhangella methanolivorans TaxID=1437009 RepID=A0A9E6RBZ1_9HYPH|nr:cytochrome c(L), periplasmic [Chenggangzhangella methanolivorans]QZO01437.1 cytochrome c(L), periplasmic [Chenggangzhangella methanolivorans]
MKKSVRAALAAALFCATAVSGAHAQQTFNNAVTGETLNLDDAMPEGRDTQAVKTFIESGENVYLGDKNCLAKGEQAFLAMCSGCHGQKAEGKLGPGLNDTHWTYPQGRTDKGLFEIIFGGAQGMMGPMHGAMTLDEMLLAMAWVRHLYKDDPAEAGEWLTADLAKDFKPYKGEPAPQPGADAPESCKIGG